MYLLKMSGPQIRLCLFTFRPIASKQLKSLTTIDTFSRLGGAMVTHMRFRCKWSRVKSPGPARVFMFDFFVLCCCVFSLCPKTHYLSQTFAISYAMLIYLVYFTDLASLNEIKYDCHTIGYKC